MVLLLIITISPYPWLRGYDSSQTIIRRIQPPEGYRRIEASPFGEWLRHLPLKRGRPPVYLYNGRKKADQTVHHAVVDLDVGDEDLQQCADAIIRLRAEYLYQRGCFDSIGFLITSGDWIRFRKWISGFRPVVRGNRVTWIRKGISDSSYQSFREYLRFIFKYAGTYSLAKELKKTDPADPQIGDVFIQPGFPGHAILIIDLARDPRTGKMVMLLGQSFLPAQDFHILNNPENPSLSPWYEVKEGGELITPEWEFDFGDLSRW
ncbi:hypothetical protein DRP53_10480 [candidate division WOR-3 bacterium]|uniref:DUF4846 domain-containing protein n=1 Tax=candidate division WOR-3 bacterium TaxID=2052148 RepID=A0A660SD27_UNCW3|nr:MAG: hypothetical protein DRP53_10480 [candidate division WOR-3 bacterium]